MMRFRKVTITISSVIVCAIGLLLLSRCGDPSVAAKWKFRAGSTLARTDMGARIVVDKGTIYFISKDVYDIRENKDEEDYLRAVDAETGRERWNYKFPGSRESGPAVGDGLIYFGMSGIGSGIAHLYAVDAATGQKVWRTGIGDYTQELLPPIVDHGLVYFGTKKALDEDNGSLFYLYALDAKSAEQRWTRKMEGGASVYTVSNGVVYFGEKKGGQVCGQLPVCM